MRGTWQGSCTWQTGGPDLSGLIGVAVVAGVIYAVAEILLALLWWIVAVVGVALAIAVVPLGRRARQDRPGRPIAAPVVYPATPEQHPRLEEPRKPAIAPPPQVTINIFGVPTAEQAEVIRRAIGGPPGGYHRRMADLPDGRDHWIRWDQELTSTCPECGRVWADHPGGIELRAIDGHLGRVLPECPQESGGAQ